jgi:formamidopyrimidine-DNA glycosylase
MPELPEVQTIVDDLIAAGIPGATIVRARVFWPRSIAEPSPRAFCSAIKGRQVNCIRRRGKFMVFELSGGLSLLMHLRMSGRLHWVPSHAKRLPHEHVVVEFDNGRQLRLHDTRKFGRFYLVKDPQGVLGRLGPEPLARSFTAAALARRLTPRKRLLKPLLLDQTVIAGLGNIYVDESLWEAGLHPCRLASSLAAQEIEALHRAICRVLKRGLKNQGTSLGSGKPNFYSVARRQGRNRDELKVFRRTGLPCLRCKTPIQRIVVGQRSTHVCPECQRVGE